jgi:hypothetical protein
MKRYIQYYALAVVASFGLTSCLDGDPVFEPDGGPMGIVELVLPARTTSTVYASKTVTLEPVDEYLLPVEINYTGFSGAPEDILVTLAIDDEAVSRFDASITPIPASYYVQPASFVATIPKGEKKAAFAIKLIPKNFDLTGSFAIGVKIVSATKGTVSGNYSTGIYRLPVKNKYEGHYVLTGTLVDDTNPDFVHISANYGKPYTVFLKTLDAHTVTFIDEITWGDETYPFYNGGSRTGYGSFGPQFIFDAGDNLTEVVNSFGQPAGNTRSAELDPSGVNKYDPATKTISVSYWMNQPSVVAGHRTHFVETYVWSGN